MWLSLLWTLSNTKLLTMLIHKLPSLGFTAYIPQRLIEAFHTVVHYYFRLSADSRWNYSIISWSVHFQKVTFAIIKANDILLMKSHFQIPRIKEFTNPLTIISFYCQLFPLFLVGPGWINCKDIIIRSQESLCQKGLQAISTSCAKQWQMQGRAYCSRLHLDKSWKPPWTETVQSLWATCSTACLRSSSAELPGSSLFHCQGLFPA